MEDVIKAKINGQWLGGEVARTIYCRGKAKLLNIVESLGLEPKRETAVKRMVENVLDEITQNASDFVMMTLEGWEQEVEFGGEPTAEEKAEALKEYEEVQKILK